MTEHLSAVGFQSGAQAGSSISQGKGVASCSPVSFSCVRGPTISYSQQMWERAQKQRLLSLNLVFLIWEAIKESHWDRFQVYIPT